MKLKNLLFFIPFASFILGYNLISYFFVAKDVEIPNVIGKTLIEATKILSDHNLNMQILKQRNDNSLPDETVIDQTPINKKIKINRTIYLTVIKQDKEFKIPDFKLQKLEEIQHFTKKHNIKTKVYYLKNNLDKDLCIGQLPLANTLIDKNHKIILYISAGNKKPVLFPDFKNLELVEVTNFLKLHNLKASVFLINTEPYNQNKIYTIIDQRPIPGSLVDLNKINIELHVQ